MRLRLGDWALILGFIVFRPWPKDSLARTTRLEDDVGEDGGAGGEGTKLVPEVGAPLGRGDAGVCEENCCSRCLAFAA